MLQMMKYTVRFVTPAFLGDAEQKGAWRAPPFKALMRQWWRVLAAREHGYDHEKLRRAEGRLFGHAWLEGASGKTWAMKSQVLVRLSRWEQGTLHCWSAKEPRVVHPEVEIAPKGIGAHLYLGYGPLNFDKATKGSRLVVGAALDLDEKAEFSVICPDRWVEELRRTIQLMQWFGTVGGRSRNGWGSFLLEGQGIEGFDALKSSHSLIQKVARPLRDCLTRDWPHAIGKDERSVLVWKSKARSQGWSDVVRELAEAKVKFRTDLPFQGPKNRFEKRHLLGYPVTNHPVSGWGKGRLGNQIRFKIVRDEQGYLGLIYHMPCSLPGQLVKDFNGNSNDLKAIQASEQDIWRRVHNSLDQNNSFERI